MERKQCLFTAALVLAGGLIGGLLATALGGTHGIEAQGTSITTGTVTAQELRVVDMQGRVRLRAVVADDGVSTFAVLDAVGQARAVVGVDASGVPAIGLTDRTGRARVSLDLESNIPSLQIYDQAGTSRIYLGEGNEGTPFLDITDQQGQRRIFLGQQTTGAPRIDIRDASGSPVWFAPPVTPTPRPSPTMP